MNPPGSGSGRMRRAVLYAPQSGGETRRPSSGGKEPFKTDQVPNSTRQPAADRRHSSGSGRKTPVRPNCAVRAQSTGCFGKAAVPPGPLWKAASLPASAQEQPKRCSSLFCRSSAKEKQTEVVADMGLIKAYVNALKVVDNECGTDLRLDARTLMGIPGALTETAAEIDPEEVWAVLGKAGEEACEIFAKMRKTEGEKLAAVLKETGEKIAQLLETVRERAPLVPKEFRAKLEERIEELELKGVDQQRIAAEVAIYADKCSVDEEIARLDSHLSQLHTLLDSDGAVGKQLDFLVQEMNREVNTIGSKANDLTLTKAVLAMKNEVEKLREQIQNVE